MSALGLSVDSSWHTDDEDFLDDLASPLTTGTNTMSPSREGSPQPISRSSQKKRVDWILPEQPDSRVHSRAASPDRRDASHEASPEELRNFLHKISSSDAELRPIKPGQFAIPPPHRTVRRPKSALRQTTGDVTPLIYNQSPEALDDGILDLPGKQRSAQSAQLRAAQMAESAGTRGSDLYRYVEDGLATGQTTPAEYDYVPRPEKYRLGGLSAVRLLNKARRITPVDDRTGRSRWRYSPRGSSVSLPDLAETSSSRQGGTRTPKRRRSPVPSVGSLTELIGSSAQFGAFGGRDIGQALAKSSHSRSSSTDSLPGQRARPGLPRSASSGILETLSKLGGYRTKPHDDIQVKITKHVQETNMRHRYLVKLCHALMVYGAPTHRLEEYLRASARILEIEAQFLYIPGCVLISFDDSRTYTSEVKLVRNAQGVDLGKLRDTHEVYKEVIHDIIGVGEATDRLNEIGSKPDKFNIWLRIFMYGIASASVGPFAFGARPIDLPIAFILGCILGFLQLYVAPRAELWTHVFELVAVVITTFLARAAGSIRGGDLFCFSALAQSAIALILPGYLVLSAALELQSRSIIAGSVRLVYAIFYSLFLGFGLTLGAALYGLADPKGASSAKTCQNPVSRYWFFFSVPVFTFTLLVINQAKWKQMPMMLFIALAGYLVNYFTSQHFSGNTQISSMFGALTISVIANLYGRMGIKVYRALDGWHLRGAGTPLLKLTTEQPSTPSSLEKQTEAVSDGPAAIITPLGPVARLIQPFRQWRICTASDNDTDASTASADRPPTTPSTSTSPPNISSTPQDHPSSTPQTAAQKRIRLNYGLAAAAMLPAIFVQVPSGLAVSGSLVAGITSADQITGNATGSSTLTSTDVTTGALGGSNVSFNVAYSVLEVAIGITVGLFLGSLVVYPRGKGGGAGGGRGKVGGRGGRGGLFSF